MQGRAMTTALPLMRPHEAMCAAALCACLVGATADRRSVFGQCFSNLTLTFAAAALASLVNAVFCAR